MTAISAATQTPKVALRSPADLVTGVPYLLGFHPEDSVVVLALTGKSVTCAARCDADPQLPEELACYLIDAVLPTHPTGVAVLGYGAEEQVGRVVTAVRTHAERRGLTVTEALRVDGGRWWSYLCDDPRCCPPEGTPFDAQASQAAAACTVEGLSALPSRAELARQVAPLSGSARESMTQATDRAWARLSDQLEAVPDERASETVLAEGASVVADALERYGAGERLDDDEVAWLSVLLQSIPVRDAAWLAIQSEQPHRRLWLDVTRRADPELVPAPASLLAFAAYRAGDGPLAGLALERALGEDPSYSMAQLLRHALQQGLPPSVFDGWGTPQWSGPGSGHPTRSAPA